MVALLRSRSQPRTPLRRRSSPRSRTVAGIARPASVSSWARTPTKGASHDRQAADARPDDPCRRRRARDRLQRPRRVGCELHSGHQRLGRLGPDAPRGASECRARGSDVEREVHVGKGRRADERTTIGPVIELGHVTDRKPPFRYAAYTRVQFSETDAQGVVYYGRYMPYFDLSRTEYHRHLGRVEIGAADFVMRAM